MHFEYGPNDEAVIEVTGDALKIRFDTWELDTRLSTGTSLDLATQTLSVATHGVGAQRVLVSTGGSDTPNWDTEWHYMVRDIVGSLVASTDSTGALEFQQEYDAFGKLQRRTDADGRSSLGSGYTGHRDLHGLSLVSMKARLYDPELARFINADPIMQSPLYSQSSNRYAYVFNNPLKYVDPTGMVAEGGGSKDGHKEVEVFVVWGTAGGGFSGGVGPGGGGFGGGGGKTLDDTVEDIQDGGEDAFDDAETPNTDSARRESAAPVLKLFDSGFFEVESPDDSLLAKVRERFRDVRETTSDAEI